MSDAGCFGKGFAQFLFGNLGAEVALVFCNKVHLACGKNDAVFSEIRFQRGRSMQSQFYLTFAAFVPEGYIGLAASFKEECANTFCAARDQFIRNKFILALLIDQQGVLLLGISQGFLLRLRQPLLRPNIFPAAQHLKVVLGAGIKGQ